MEPITQASVLDLLLGPQLKCKREIAYWLGIYLKKCLLYRL
uniref:Uncharacterized protein n=1 Tax=Arundo donax TaxID=35708 RepID=A0A0A9E6U2_ARUDO